MRDRDISDRVKATLQDPATTADTKKLLEERLLATYDHIATQLNNAYFIFLLLMAGYTLLAVTAVKELTVLGAKLERKDVALVLLLMLASYFFYRAMALAGFSSLVDEAVRCYHSEQLGPLWNNDVSDLFLPPTVFNVENTFRNILRRTAVERVTNSVAAFTLGVVMIFGPLVWFVWACYYLIGQSPVSKPWSIAVSVVVCIFTMRGTVALRYAATY